MRIDKVRCGADQTGFVPMGAYFEKLAANLRDATAIESARREAAGAEDDRLEARYRRAGSARARTTHIAH
jgi:hypothetical protein